MTTYDAVMIGMVAAGMIWGTIRGFAWQIASIGSLVLGYLCSHQVSAYLLPYLETYLPGTPALQRGRPCWWPMWRSPARSSSRRGR